MSEQGRKMDTQLLVAILVATFIFGFAAGVAATLFVIARPAVKRHLEEFEKAEAEIDRHNAELQARIKRGCRQRIDLPHDLEEHPVS